MQLEERLFLKIKTEPSLSFIDSFLRDNQLANIYLVGGAVRDSVMGRETKDFDLVIGRVDPKIIEQWFSARGTINLVGDHFGVYKFLPKGFSSHETNFIDIALPRTESVTSGSLGGYHDFDVQSDPSLSIEDDLKRRDFTINAMAFDLRNKKLIDPFQGQEDIKVRLIRAVGDAHERLEEDLTRILRAIRFASTLGFRIDLETADAIKKLAPCLNQIRQQDDKKEFVVPREVIGEELTKSIASNPSTTIMELSSLGVLKELFPRVNDLAIQSPAYLEPLSRAKPNEPIIALSLLLRGLDEITLGQAVVFAGLDRLSRDSKIRLDVKLLHWLIRSVKESITPDQVNLLPASAFENGFMGEHGSARVKCLNLLGETALVNAAAKRRKTIEDRWLVDEDEHIAPLLSGNDVLSQGITPGPEVRVWLNRIRDAQLDGELLSREAALRWLKENVHK
jgi:tRNA nucleotidyltransferase/poly(A) polymerase